MEGFKKLIRKYKKIIKRRKSVLDPELKRLIAQSHTTRSERQKDKIGHEILYGDFGNKKPQQEPEEYEYL